MATALRTDDRPSPREDPVQPLPPPPTAEEIEQRLEIAKFALMGLLASDQSMALHGEHRPDYLAGVAFEHADAMVRAQKAYLDTVKAQRDDADNRRRGPSRSHEAKD